MEDPHGLVLVTDFLPPSDDHADLVRRVKCLEGTVQVEHDLRIRFDYGRITPWVRRVDLDNPAGGGDHARMGDSPSHPHPVGTSDVPYRSTEGHEEDGPDERRRHDRDAHGDGDGYDARAASWYRGFRNRVHDAAHDAEASETVGQGLLAMAGPGALLLTGPALEPYQLGRDDQEVEVAHGEAHGPGADIRALEGLRRGHRGTFSLDEGSDWTGCSRGVSPTGNCSSPRTRNVPSGPPTSSGWTGPPPWNAPVITGTPSRVHCSCCVR